MPQYHSDRALTGYWISMPPSQVAADVVTVSAVVVPKGTLEPLESLPREIRKKGQAWDAEEFRDGWVNLRPSSDSRLIYVATNGNDSQAAAAKGRGYYLPGDPEIGPDPTNPVGPIVAYASVAEAAKRFRGRNWDSAKPDQTGANNGIPQYTTGLSSANGNGYPDWLLFRRGQTFTMPTVQTDYGTEIRPPSRLVGYWSANYGSNFGYHSGGASGRSASEPCVIGAWGPPSDPRPVIDVFGVDGNARNMALVSIETPNALTWSYSQDGNTADNLLVEDVKARSFGSGNITLFKNARFRRCVVQNTFNPAAHNQGFFLSGTTKDLVIEECVFDRNGYKEDPTDATKWTAKVASNGVSGVLPAGTGVQPTRTYFDRNLYLSSYADMRIRGCIISRGGGGGSVQMRQGGVMERNLFMFNESAGFCASGSGGIVKDNLILHDDHMLPAGGYGQLIGVWNNGFGGVVKPNQTYVMDGNIAAHFHRRSNGEAGFYAREAVNESDGALLGGSVYILNNAVYREGPNSFYGFAIYRDSWTTVKVGNNAVGILNGTITGEKVAASAAAGGANYEIGSSASGGNKYWSLTSTPFDGPAGVKYTFAQWQASRSGLDSASTFTSDLAAFKTAAGWTAPERDIVSYMQSVDPTYVVNEEVYVDEDATVKQATRQKVREVLMNSSLVDLPMSDSDARKTARRYHAFVTFIQRAKANRKGAWDPRWTAEAVNNYIREGFGKTKVSGPYLATMQTLESYS